MFNTNYEGKEKELNFRGLKQDDLILPDSGQFYLSSQNLTKICNIISNKIQRKLLIDEVEKVRSYIRQLDPSRYSLSNNPHLLIAEDFMENRQIGVPSIGSIIHSDGPATLHDYQKKELNQFTPDENQYKISVYGDRRGNAVIDKERVSGKRTPTEAQAKELFLEAAESVKQFLNADNVDDIMRRFRTNWTNYFSITLPHQTIQFDSRNRDTQNKSAYSWSLNVSSNQGLPGTIKLQDTIQNVVQMKIGAFWLPFYNPINLYYGNIRMAITEFEAQAIEAPEYLTTSTVATREYYHFEFQIKRIVNNRALLVPSGNPVGEFVFRKPMAQVNTITALFRYPFNQLLIQQDRNFYTMTYGVTTSLNTTTNDNLATGDLIYILNSNTGKPAIDQILINPVGFIITKTGPTSFTINVDTSSLIGSQTVTVFYGSKRLEFAIEFVTLEQ